MGRLTLLFLFEWRLLASTRTPWLAACLFLVLSAVALVNGYEEQNARQDGYDAAVAARAEQYAVLSRDLVRIEQQRAQAGIPPTRLRPGLPSAAAADGRLNTFRVALPPLAPTILNTGRAQTFPQRYEIRGGGGARWWPFGRTVDTRILSGLYPEQPMTNPAAAVLGVFDLAFVVTYAYPLLIVVLVYNVVSADRESGTLALAASQPIAFRRWLAARVAVRALLIVVCGVLLPTAGAVLTIADWSTESLMPIGLWTAAVLGYSMFWLACVVAVSLTMASSALSAIVSVSAWLVVVIAVPAVIELAAPLLNPASTRLSYATHERGASLEMNSRVDAAIAALNQLSRTQFEAFAENDGDHPTFTEPVDAPVESNLLEALPHPPWSSRMPVVQLARGFGEARRIVVEERLAPVLRELVAAEVREAAFIAYTRFLSPALLFQAMADDVTGTGQERWKRFLAQVDDYVREQDSFFTRKILANQNVTSQELATRAPFRFQEEESSAIVSRVAVPLSTLLIMAVGMWMLCIRWSRHWPQ